MSNSSNELSPASRAMLTGAMIGGAASAISQWKSAQTGEITTEQFAANFAKDTLKAGAISGATTYVAGKMAGQPVLSMLTLVAAGAASVYLYDKCVKGEKDEQL